MLKSIEKLKKIADESIKSSRQIKTLEDMLNTLADNDFCGEILINKKAKNHSERILSFRTYEIEKYASKLESLKYCEIVNIRSGQYPVAPPIDFYEIDIIIKDHYLKEISKQNINHMFLSTKLCGCVQVPDETYDELKDCIVVVKDKE